MTTTEHIVRLGRPVALAIGWLLTLWGAFVLIAVFINLADVVAYALAGRLVQPEWPLLLFVLAVLGVGMGLRRAGGGRPFKELLRRRSLSS